MAQIKKRDTSAVLAVCV